MKIVLNVKDDGAYTIGAGCSL